MIMGAEFVYIRRLYLEVDGIERESCIHTGVVGNTESTQHNVEQYTKCEWLT